MADEDRPVRMCDSCGGVDTAPRHVVAHAPGDAVTASDIAAKALKNAGEEHFADILAQVQDQSLVLKHMDCCRADGCPDGSCDSMPDLKDDDLVRELTKEF